MFKNFLPFIFAIVLFLFAFIPHAKAAQHFTTDYNVTYEATEAGVTRALLKITLTNTTSKFYASSYKVNLGLAEISNVRASDPGGPITPTITKTDDGYAIGVKFNKKAVGMGDKITFTVAFDTPTITNQYGKVWEINIPGISDPDAFASFTVAVKTPASFGKPTYIKPAQVNNDMVFTKDQLGKSGISIAYGDKQLYAFHLNYHLMNTNVIPVTTEIALPPTTNYQEVYITNMQPKPKNVVIDRDGNWLAQYKLMPLQKMDVEVDGKAQVNLTPEKVELSPQEIAAYTKAQPYWDANAPEIKTLAKELKTPQAIYEYVAKTLKYDFDRVRDGKPRLGAVGSLQQQDSAACREFTDLFIAIARSAGIPARQVEGYAHTENAKQRPLSLEKDILHAWPEYYDFQKKTWIMVDPTWGSTTGGIDYFSVLDFDHLAFVIKGLDSSEPVPAGGYKLAEHKESKDVDVSFTDSLPTNTNKLTLTSNIPQTVIAGLPIIGETKIENTTSTLLSKHVLSISSSQLSPDKQLYPVPEIPPFGHAQVPFEFAGKPFLANEQADFTMQVEENKVDQKIQIAPFYLTYTGLGGMGLIILAVILIIVASRHSRHKNR